MKNKYILFTALSIGIGFSSCTDYLSVEDKLKETTQNIEKVFESKDYTEQWLAQCYVYLTRDNVDIHAKDYCITNFSDDMCYGDRNLEYRKFKYAEYDENWKDGQMLIMV